MEVEIKISMDYLYLVVEPHSHKILLKALTLLDAMAFCAQQHLAVTFNL